MSSNLSPYQYEALRPASQNSGEFRLLTLLPGLTGSQINCKLQRAPLNSPPRYEALSYTWGNPKGLYSMIPVAGDPDSSHIITLNGHGATIAYNLEAALQQLRHEFQERSLWVDAVCIDQTNKSERSEQVRVMADIYKGADRVLVWLGEHDDYVDLAFDGLEELCWATKVLVYQYCAERHGLPLSEISQGIVRSLMESELGDPDARATSPFKGLDSVQKILKFTQASSRLPFDASTRALSNFTEMAVTEWGSTRSFAKSILADPCILSNVPHLQNGTEAMQEVFFLRSYWKRLWVVQELLLPPRSTIICGRRQMDLNMMILPEVLVTAVDPDNEGSNLLWKNADYEFMQRLKTVLVEPLSFLRSSGRQRGEALASLVESHSLRLCSEPRDAIYALLALSTPVNILPDYALPIADIYSNATKTIIDQEQNLDIICTKVMEPQSEARGAQPSVELPTWVPHFESMIHSCGMCQPTGSNLSLSGSAFKVEDPRVLLVDGCFSGQIKTAGPRIQSYQYDDSDFFSLCLTSVKASISSRVAKMAASPRDLASALDCWSTLILNAYPEPSSHRYRRISESSESKTAFELDLEEALTSTPPIRLLRELKRGVDHKAFCTTTGGNAALVLGDAKPGDCVFLTKGATNPLILRPTVADATFDAIKQTHRVSSFYEFVGGSYVHGIMDGEMPATANGQEIGKQTVGLI